MAAALKLRALGYPAAAAGGGSLATQPEGRAVGRAELATLAAWLEDVKIRALPVAARGALREGASGGGGGEAWERALGAYLKELQCPYEASLAFGDDTGRYVLASWLLGTAVAYEYADGAKKFNASAARPAEADAAAAAARDGGFTDLQSGETREAALALAVVLGVKHAPDAPLLGVLESCAKAAERLASSGGGSNAGSAENGAAGGDADPLSSLPLGFETGDLAVDRAATALRCLFINDLRSLQTAVDRLLVSVQEHTANPKTDTKRGKVGR